MTPAPTGTPRGHAVPVEFQCPPRDPAATKSWRKALTHIDSSQRGGFALVGPFLEPGATYRAFGRGTIVCYDHTGQGHVLLLLAVTDRGTRKLLRLRRTGPWATPATLTRLAAAVAAHPWNDGQPVQAAPAANTGDAFCSRCRVMVPAGEGIVVRDDSGRSAVRHAACPPRLVRQPLRNDREAECGACGGWLAVEEGIVINMGRWRIFHEERCPPPGQRKPMPPRHNERDQECTHCGLVVAAGTGWLLRRSGMWLVRHDTCPDTGAPDAAATSEAHLPEVRTSTG